MNCHCQDLGREQCTRQRQEYLLKMWSAVRRRIEISMVHLKTSRSFREAHLLSGSNCECVEFGVCECLRRSDEALRDSLMYSQRMISQAEQFEQTAAVHFEPLMSVALSINETAMPQAATLHPAVSLPIDNSNTYEEEKRYLRQASPIIASALTAVCTRLYLRPSGEKCGVDYACNHLADKRYSDTSVERTDPNVYIVNSDKSSSGCNLRPSVDILPSENYPGEDRLTVNVYSTEVDQNHTHITTHSHADDYLPYPTNSNVYSIPASISHKDTFTRRSHQMTSVPNADPSSGSERELRVDDHNRIDEHRSLDMSCRPSPLTPAVPDIPAHLPDLSCKDDDWDHRIATNNCGLSSHILGDRVIASTPLQNPGSLAAIPFGPSVSYIPMLDTCPTVDTTQSPDDQLPMNSHHWSTHPNCPETRLRQSPSSQLLGDRVITSPPLQNPGSLAAIPFGPSVSYIPTLDICPTVDLTQSPDDELPLMSLHRSRHTSFTENHDYSVPLSAHDHSMASHLLQNPGLRTDISLGHSATRIPALDTCPPEDANPSPDDTPFSHTKELILLLSNYETNHAHPASVGCHFSSPLWQRPRPLVGFNPLTNEHPVHLDAATHDDHSQPTIVEPTVIRHQNYQSELCLRALTHAGMPLASALQCPRPIDRLLALSINLLVHLNAVNRVDAQSTKEPLEKWIMIRTRSTTYTAIVPCDISGSVPMTPACPVNVHEGESSTPGNISVATCEPPAIVVTIHRFLVPTLDHSLVVYTRLPFHGLLPFDPTWSTEPQCQIQEYSQPLHNHPLSDIWAHTKKRTTPPKNILFVPTHEIDFPHAVFLHEGESMPHTTVAQFLGRYSGPLLCPGLFSVPASEYLCYRDSQPTERTELQLNSPRRECHDPFDADLPAALRPSPGLIKPTGCTIIVTLNISCSSEKKEDHWDSCSFTNHETEYPLPTEIVELITSWKVFDTGWGQDVNFLEKSFR